ncbi:jg13534 [Pararge aegeria aegeria]|uniref:ATP-dependent DNA helicase n=1 Tax=Pararge aegeria aegeria TaxID=348720 RepID=A0A8S4QQ83_9NEOP|nr:jg13534 [Pararge aegeria aegeria]
MSKQQYCELVRTTNPEQRQIILEVIHRLHGCGDYTSEAVQIYFTGPADCGKTYTLKCLTETYNRYTQEHNSINNAYIACASTGKAAVPLGGTTVHSAFRLTTSRVTKLLSRKFASLQKHVRRRQSCFHRRDQHVKFSYSYKLTTDCSRLLAYTTNLSETFTLYYVEISDSFHLYEQLHVILCRKIKMENLMNEMNQE